jgi:hypothetical protein
MSAVERNTRPGRTDLKWFGPILAVLFVIVGLIAMFRFDAPGVAKVVWAVGVPFVVAYFAVPALRIPIYVGYMTLVFPLGWLVSHVVLAVLFFLIVTPTALVLRIVRYDPLKRRWERQATSYWTDHRTGGDVSRYLRQF